MRKKIEILSACPLFSGVKSEDMEALLHCMNPQFKNFAKGSYLKTAGDPCDFIGVVLEGNLHIIRDDYYGNRSITASLGKGEMFAEAFACAGIDKLPIDIYAPSDVSVMLLDKYRLLHQCQDACPFHNLIIQNLLQIVAMKNIMLTQKLRYVSHKTIRDKLLAYLNDQAKLYQSSSFTIPFDRQSLADYLGVDRSAMSNELSKMQKEGLLITNRSAFQLLK